MEMNIKLSSLNKGLVGHWTMSHRSFNNIAIANMEFKRDKLRVKYA